METFGWGHFVVVLLASAGGFYLGFSTKLKSQDPVDSYGLKRTLSWFVKVCGLVIGVGGLVAAIELLLILMRG